MRTNSLSRELEQDAKILMQFAQSAVQAVRAGDRTPSCGARLDLSAHELRRWSWGRAVTEIRPDYRIKKADGLERDCHQELAKRFDIPLGSFAIPQDVLEYRGLDYFVGASAPSGLSFIDMLRNRSVVYRLGAQRLTGLQDDVAIPRQTANSTVTWLGTGGSSVTATDAAFGQVSATPKTACIITEVSEQLLRQSSADIIIPRGLAADLAVGLDAAVINGSGGVQPLGVLNTPIGTASGTTLGYTGLVGLQKTVADANAILDPASLGYATTPTIGELLKGRQRFSSTDSPLWAGAIHEGTIEGVRAVSSKQMPASTLLYGDWSSIFIGEWGPLMLTADNGGTRFSQAQVGIRALWLLDLFVTAPTAFVKVTSIT